MYEAGEVYFRLLRMSDLHLNSENERFTAVGSRCRRDLKYGNFTLSFGRRQKFALKKRAARAARLFFLIQQNKSIIRAVFVSVAVVIRGGSLTSNDGKATKTSLENKHLGNVDYFVIISSSSHPLFLIEHAGNGLVEAPLK